RALRGGARTRVKPSPGVLTSFSSRPCSLRDSTCVGGADPHFRLASSCELGSTSRWRARVARRSAYEGQTLSGRSDPPFRLDPARCATARASEGLTLILLSPLRANSAVRSAGARALRAV